MTNQTGSDDADTRTAFESVSDFSEFTGTEDNSSSSCYRTDEPDAWVDCAGLLEHMLELVNNDGNLALNLVKEAAVPDIELFALHVVNLAGTLLNQCNKLKKIATHCLCEIKENEGRVTEHGADSLPDHDPGNAEKISSDNQRRYLINLGPCQPKIGVYPSNLTIKSGKQNKFSNQWFKEYPHLE